MMKTLDTVGESDNVTLWGILGARLLNPGFLTKGFQRGEGVEYHVLWVYAVDDGLGVKATSGNIIVSTKDSLMEGYLVVVRGSNRQFRLQKSWHGEYYAVSWHKKDGVFYTKADVVSRLQPEEVHNAEVRKYISNRLHGTDETVLYDSFPIIGSNMIGISSQDSEEHTQESKKDWVLLDGGGVGLSISHREFHGVSEDIRSMIQMALESNSEELQSYQTDEDAQFLDRLANQWRRALLTRGLWVEKAGAENWVESMQVGGLIGALEDKGFPVEHLTGEQVIWLLSFLPARGGRRLHTWLEEIQNADEGQVKRFAYSALRDGYTVLQKVGRQEYGVSGESRLGVCLRLVGQLKDADDLVTPWFELGELEQGVELYPETTSTFGWLEDCLEYSSMVEIRRYYLETHRAARLMAVIDELEQARIHGASEAVVEGDEGVQRFVHDYLSGGTQYSEKNPYGDELMLRVLSELR